MPASTTSTTLQTTEIPEASPPGRVSLALTTWSRTYIIAIELVIHVDTISVRCGFHEYAVMEKDAFRYWLNNPEAVFAVDHIMWTKRGKDLCISINSGPTYPILRDTIPGLHRAI